MNLLITYAVEAEFAPWRKLRAPQKVNVGTIEAHRIQLGQTVVDFLITGVGIMNARRNAEAVLSSDYSACVVSGFAGALSSGCKLGDVIAPQSVRLETSATSLSIVEDLQHRAVQAGAINIPALITADHVVATANEKSRLAAHGDAVDMESFAILEVAQAKKIPAAVLRVISDDFDTDLPENLDSMIDTHGNLKMGGVVRYVTAHPTKVPALMRLGRDSKAAAAALANFLEKFIEKMSSETQIGNSRLQQVAS